MHLFTSMTPARLSLLIVTSLAAPIFYLEGSGLFVFLSHRKRNQYHPYHRSGSFVRRSQYQRHRRLKQAPGGKLQDRSGVYPRWPYAALSPPATATRVQLRRPHAAPSPSAAASCEIDGVHQLYPRNSVSWWQRAAAAYAATADGTGAAATSLPPRQRLRHRRQDRLCGTRGGEERKAGTKKRNV